MPKSTNPKETTLFIRVPEEMKTELWEEARSLQMRLSEYVRMILTEWRIERRIADRGRRE